MQQVIFLDVDGVLNSQRSCLAFGNLPSGMHPKAWTQLDPLALNMIRDIAALADAKIVLSSTWRMLRPVEEYARDFDLPIVDKTAVGSSSGRERGYEIQDWLDLHPEVENYAIIDDDSDMLDHQMAHFVHTSGLDGFLYRDALKLGAILGVLPWDRPSKKLENKRKD